MKKLAIIDLLFNWPPDGGARIDVKEVASRLSKHMDVTMFVPDFQLYCRRGDIRETMPFRVVTVPFDRFTFNFFQVAQSFKKEIDAFQPDFVILADGWYLKPYLCVALADYKPLIRFYAYETLCLRSHGVLYVNDDLCPVDFLGGSSADVNTCIRCGREVFQDRLDNLYGQEFYGALAHTRRYRNTVIHALTHAGGLICYNSFIASRLSRYNNRVHIIPSGVDASIFLNSSLPALDESASSGKQIIFMPGRADDPVKGLQILDKAGSYLQKKRTDFEIWFTSLNQFEPQNNYMKNIGWLKPEELPAVYNKASICVIPSLWAEPFGIITLEAMASGKPVIVFRRGGLADTVVHNETGRIIDTPDPESLADEIDLLLSDRDRCVQMGKNGRQRVIEHYQWDTIISRYYLPLLQ